MILTALLCIATTVAFLSLYVCAIYPPSCKALERHMATLQPNVRSDQEGAFAWRDERWALEGTRMRIALCGIGLYAVGMAVMIPVMQMTRSSGQEATWNFILMGAISLIILVISLRSFLHNQRLLKIETRRLN